MAGWQPEGCPSPHNARSERSLRRALAKLGRGLHPDQQRKVRFEAAGNPPLRGSSFQCSLATRVHTPLPLICMRQLEVEMLLLA